MTGRVDLVGGGPGPIDLLTVRAWRLLLQADVVVMDRLGPTDIRSHVATHVEIIDVGKLPGHHPVPQDEINAILVDRARAGNRVVRLKGGDPFVFGRGGEELTACLAAGIPVDVVPGVTSAVAVPEAAGIPVTHRGIASAVHIVNGQSEVTSATLAALADVSVTTVILMGVGALPRLVADALRAGVPRTRPVAIVERGHHDDQRTTHSTLGAIVVDAGRIGVRNPAVIVVGEVARAGLLVPDLLAAQSGLGGSA